jgi:hypothetical protein
MKYLLLLIIPLSLTSCFTQRPIYTDRPNNNRQYEVEYLFEHDGCKVYRFYDRGNYVYFTNCRGEAIAKTDSGEVRSVSKRF